MKFIHWMPEDRYFMHEKKMKKDMEMMGGMVECRPVNMHGRPVPLTKGDDQNAIDKIEAIKERMGCIS